MKNILIINKIKSACLKTATLIAIGIILACGSDSNLGNDLSKASGVVVDGYIRKAKVFLDCNGNFILDADEKLTTTKDFGEFTFTSATDVQIATCPVVVDATDTSTVVDTDDHDGTKHRNLKDAGREGFKMASPPGEYSVISPLSTVSHAINEETDQEKVMRSLGIKQSDLDDLGVDFKDLLQINYLDESSLTDKQKAVAKEIAKKARVLARIFETKQSRTDTDVNMCLGQSCPDLIKQALADFSNVYKQMEDGDHFKDDGKLKDTANYNKMREYVDNTGDENRMYKYDDYNSDTYHDQHAMSADNYLFLMVLKQDSGEFCTDSDTGSDDFEFIFTKLEPEQNEKGEYTGKRLGIDFITSKMLYESYKKTTTSAVSCQGFYAKGYDKIPALSQFLINDRDMYTDQQNSIYYASNPFTDEDMKTKTSFDLKRSFFTPCDDDPRSSCVHDESAVTKKLTFDPDKMGIAIGTGTANNDGSFTEASSKNFIPLAEITDDFRKAITGGDHGGNHGGGGDKNPITAPQLHPDYPLAPMHEATRTVIVFKDGDVATVDFSKISLTEEGSTENILIGANTQDLGDDGVGLELVVREKSKDEHNNSFSVIQEGKNYVLTLQVGALTIGGRPLAKDAVYTGTAIPQDGGGLNLVLAGTFLTPSEGSPCNVDGTPNDQYSFIITNIVTEMPPAQVVTLSFASAKLVYDTYAYLTTFTDANAKLLSCTDFFKSEDDKTLVATAVWGQIFGNIKAHRAYMVLHIGEIPSSFKAERIENISNITQPKLNANDFINIENFKTTSPLKVIDGSKTIEYSSIFAKASLDLNAAGNGGGHGGTGGGGEPGTVPELAFFSLLHEGAATVVFNDGDVGAIDYSESKITLTVKGSTDNILTGAKEFIIPSEGGPLAGRKALQLNIKLKDGGSTSVIEQGTTYVLTLKAGALTIGGTPLAKDAVYEATATAPHDGGNGGGGEPGTAPELDFPFAPMHEVETAMLFFKGGDVGAVDASKITLTKEGSTDNILTGAEVVTIDTGKKVLQLNIKVTSKDTLGNSVSVIQKGTTYVLTLKAGALTIGGTPLAADAVYTGVAVPQSN